MRLYGLTGGTASGKSEVAKQLAAHGLPVLDADQIGHELIAPGGPAVEAVVDAFGEDILTQGVIDRTKLGALVFADSEARARLNAIVHPAIRREIGRRCRRLAREGCKAAVVDAALIAEDLEPPACLDGIILVLTSDELRVQRLVDHRGLSPVDARQRIASQEDPCLKLALARWVIHNEGSLADLHAEADAIGEEILRDAG
jgi:dephospho-CoA kinase